VCVIVGVGGRRSGVPDFAADTRPRGPREGIEEQLNGFDIPGPACNDHDSFGRGENGGTVVNVDGGK
jgi:hypothetical protein